MTTYLLNALPNALLVPYPGDSRLIEGLHEEEVHDRLVCHEFVSAIGHESTANLLSVRLGLEIPFNRLQVSTSPGDLLIVAAFVTPRRLGEGELFTQEEILGCEIKYACIRF